MALRNVAGSLALDATLAKVQHGLNDYETRFDYVSRTDSKPVYLGKNAQGTPTSDATWQIQKIDYSAGGDPTRIQVITGVWDNRATLLP